MGRACSPRLFVLFPCPPEPLIHPAGCQRRRSYPRGPLSYRVTPPSWPSGLRQPTGTLSLTSLPGVNNYLLDHPSACLHTAWGLSQSDRRDTSISIISGLQNPLTRGKTPTALHIGLDHQCLRLKCGNQFWSIRDPTTSSPPAVKHGLRAQ